MKKGFTLIELLAVIIVLAVIALITTPIVLDVVDNAKEKANEQSIRGYATAVEYKRIEELFKGNTVNDDDLTSLSVETKGNEVNCTIIKFDDELSTILYDCDLDNSTDKYCLINDEVLKNEECDEAYEAIIKYSDNSGANEPDLLTNMIPVKYDGTNWIYASEKEEWYDYDAKQWANAVVLNSGVSKNVGDTIEEADIALWYVWIPRYKYTIFNGNNETAEEQLISVTFESGTSTTGTVMCHDAINQTDSDGNKISEICIDSTRENNKIVNNVSTYTHPAFCLGTKNEDGSCNGEELTGFWFGKFEISGTEDSITIIPNATPLYRTVSKLYNAIQGMSAAYGIKDGDSHMVKNMEWGAVAYLKQSKYGLETTDIGKNNKGKTGYGASYWDSISNVYNTETGMLASTTGNIYGVYDMCGGAYEYTMGNVVNSSGEFYSGDAGFTTDTMPEAKYYDAYTYDENRESYTRGKLGDATKETLTTYEQQYGGGWYNSVVFFPYVSPYYSDEEMWFQRSGSWYYWKGGIFAFVYGSFVYDAGDDHASSTRAVLSHTT